MAAELTDNFMQVAAEGAITYMGSGGKAEGASSFSINDATGWPTTTGFIIAIRTVDPNGNEVADTYTEWVATLSGTTVSLGTDPSPVVGSDQVYAGGNLTQCYIPVSSTRDNRLVNALLVQHKQDGSHGTVTADSVTINGSAFLDGISDATYQYKITDTDLSNGYINITFAHGLDYIPWVTGQYIFNDSASWTGIPIHPLPSSIIAATNYTGLPPDATIAVTTVDATNIYVGVATSGVLALSTFDANPYLAFQFYCQPAPI